MKRFALLLPAVILLLHMSPAQAQISSAQVLSACGTAPYVAGQIKLVTQNTHGEACQDNSGGGTVTVTPTNVLSSDASGTVTAGGSYQTQLIVNRNRLNCTIQNNDASKAEPLFVSIASSPNAGNSYVLQYGDSWSCTAGNVVMGDAIKISAATTGHTFVETSQ